VRFFAAESGAPPHPAIKSAETIHHVESLRIGAQQTSNPYCPEQRRQPDRSNGMILFASDLR
jgi:hypothetical protein